MRNVSGESYRENKITHCVFKNFFVENRVFFKTMWKNIEEPGRP
jgi:hypothetical protein